MRWIYLSPHFDDAVLSCGGLIWEQINRGESVEIWTLCAGYPPREFALSEFAAGKHAEWQVDERTAVRVRREEDRRACARLGAGLRWWSLPDCIYRRLPAGEAVIRVNDDLWLPLHPGEQELVARLRGWLRRTLRADDHLVCPLTLGNHMDHRLARSAAEGLRRSLYYYADYPYIDRGGLIIPAGLPAEQLYGLAVTQAGLLAWQESVAAYATQVSDLFGTDAEMRTKLADFWARGGGSSLWQI